MGSCGSKANQPDKVKTKNTAITPSQTQRGQDSEIQTQSQLNQREILGDKKSPSDDTSKPLKCISKPIISTSKPTKSKSMVINSADIATSKSSERVVLVKQTDDQLERFRILKTWFKKLDTNGDLRLSRDEFINGWRSQTISNLDGAEVFEQVDRNSSKFVSLKEFASWYLKRSWYTLVTDITKMANDSSPRISKKNFLEACKSNAFCREVEAIDLFRKLDVDGDGDLEIAELSDIREQDYIIRTLLESTATKGKGKPMRKEKRAPKNIRRFRLIYRNGIAKLNENEKSIREAFNQIVLRIPDRKLSRVAFVEYFTEQRVSKEDSERLFNDFAKNRNGFITYKEFRDYLTTPQWETMSKKRRSRRSPKKQ